MPDPLEDAPPAGEATALEVLLDAMRAQPTITQPEDLNGDGQEPYAKSDRVPEIALPLEAEVCRVLWNRDGTDATPGMLRLLRGRGHPDGGGVFAGLFEVLDREGGSAVDHLAAFDLGEDRFAVGARTDHDIALAAYEAEPPYGAAGHD
jgi:hypothetical protein